MSEPKEYRIRITELSPDGQVVIRDLSEPVKAFQRKITIQPRHIPRSTGLYQQAPVLAIIRVLTNKESRCRRVKNAYKGRAERWERIARILAARCHDLDKVLTRETGGDWADIFTAEQYLEAAQKQTEPKEEA